MGKSTDPGGSQQLRNAKGQQCTGGRTGAVKALQMECFKDKRIFESTSPGERRAQAEPSCGGGKRREDRKANWYRRGQGATNPATGVAIG